MFVISPEGKRVTATEKDAADMVEFCGYHYETPQTPSPAIPSGPAVAVIGAPLPKHTKPTAKADLEMHTKSTEVSGGK